MKPPWKLPSFCAKCRKVLPLYLAVDQHVKVMQISLVGGPLACVTCLQQGSPCGDWLRFGIRTLEMSFDQPWPMSGISQWLQDCLWRTGQKFLNRATLASTSTSQISLESVHFISRFSLNPILLWHVLHHLGAISYINRVTPVMTLFLRQARRSFHRSSVDVAASVSLYCVVSFQMTVTDCHPRTSLGFGCSECVLLLPSRSRCVSILQTWSCTTATSPTAPASWRSSTRWSPPRSTTSEPRATSRWAVRRSVLSLLCPELRILLFSVASFFSLSFVSFII